MNRRGFLSAILAAGAAPFVVKAGSLMAVRVPESGIIADYKWNTVVTRSLIASAVEAANPRIIVNDNYYAMMSESIGQRVSLMRDMLAFGTLKIEGPGVLI